MNTWWLWIKFNLIFLIIANPAGCWGAGPSVQRAAAEPAEQTWASDRHQTHTVIENSCCTDEMHTNCTQTEEYFCTFCTTSSAYLSWCTLSLFIFIALHFSGLHLQTCIVSTITTEVEWISNFRFKRVRQDDCFSTEVSLAGCLILDLKITTLLYLVHF